ncbi:MAG: TfoX/Sxy family protein [Comamonadaceae bacterium]|nr:TfoX/Sxy family protein [Comamonadaceae bacterium]
MFGEYAIYLDGKVVALVCDNQFFVKPTDAGRALLGRRRGPAVSGRQAALPDRRATRGPAAGVATDRGHRSRAAGAEAEVEEEVTAPPRRAALQPEQSAAVARTVSSAVAAGQRRAAPGPNRAIPRSSASIDVGPQLARR